MIDLNEFRTRIIEATTLQECVTIAKDWQKAKQDFTEEKQQARINVEQAQIQYKEYKEVSSSDVKLVEDRLERKIVAKAIQEL